MTIQEAKAAVDEYIRSANWVNEDYTDCVSVKTLQIASAAIDKRIPRKPEYEGYDEQDRILCPCCKNPVGAVDDYFEENSLNRFCFSCGQALDWGDR